MRKGDIEIDTLTRIAIGIIVFLVIFLAVVPRIAQAESATGCNVFIKSIASQIADMTGQDLLC